LAAFFATLVQQPSAHQPQLATAGRLRDAHATVLHVRAALDTTTRTLEGRRDDAGFDWQALEAIDREELAAIDALVAQLTAGAAADNLARSLETLL